MILTYCKHVHLAFKDGLEVLRENPSIDVQRASQDARLYNLTHKEAYYYQDSKNLAAINRAMESGKMSIRDAVKLLMLQERTEDFQKQSSYEDIRTNVPRHSFYLSPVGKSKTPPKTEETQMDDFQIRISFRRDLKNSVKDSKESKLVRHLKNQKSKQ
jgi:hypothetical protein